MLPQSITCFIATNCGLNSWVMLGHMRSYRLVKAAVVQGSSRSARMVKAADDDITIQEALHARCE